MLRFQWLKGWEDDLKGCFALRRSVFIEEQGFQREFDETDKKAWHLLASDGELPVGTARLYQQEGWWHIGRICVIRPFRRRGYASAILSEAERKCAELGGTQLTLSAQVRAKGLYEKNGFRECSAVYLDEFCPHVRMEKELG